VSTPRPRRSLTATLASVTALAAVVGVIHGSGSAQGSARPAAPHSEFVRTITNPYLPYRPGSRWVYRGVKDGVTQTDTVVVTHRTRVIDGVSATALTDIATHDSRVLESTTDWYAQDAKGNVWYFGEATKAYSPDGTVDTSGSWLAGVHGALPGIVMTSHPRVGDAHRQEYWQGHAEDQYWLVDLRQTVTVPFLASHHAALTMEWSRLEPGVIDQKYYVRGIGVIKEIAVRGPAEYANLVSYTH
jgi:hypothetical protein